MDPELANIATIKEAVDRAVQQPHGDVDLAYIYPHPHSAGAATMRSSDFDTLLHVRGAFCFFSVCPPLCLK